MQKTKLLNSWWPRNKAGQQHQREMGKRPYMVLKVMPLRLTQTHSQAWFGNTEVAPKSIKLKS